jgi:hypothetical protein
MPTVCADCRHVYQLNSRDGWWRWMCIKAPLPQAPNHVTGGVLDPYRLCRYINDGSCEMFEKEDHPNAKPRGDAL